MSKTESSSELQEKPSYNFSVVVGSANEAETYYKTSDYQASFEFPYNPDPLVPGNNYNIYDEMRLDDQVKASLSLKKNFIISNGWSVQCDESEEIQKFVEENLKAIGDDKATEYTFEDVLRDMLSSYDYGFSISEPIYKLRGGQYLLKTIKVRPPHSFLFHIDDKGNVIEITQETTRKGTIRIKPSKVFHHIYQPEFGNPYGRSDLLNAYQPWKTKKFVEKFLAIYLERFAAPTVVGRGGPGMSPTEVDKFENILKKIQNATSMVIPEGVSIEFIQSQKDSSETYLKCLDYYNQRISRSLLVPDLVGVGGAETKGGSFALGKKHFDIFLGSLKVDRENLERRINSKLIRPLVELNFGEKVKCEFKFLPPTSDDIIEYSKIWVEAVRSNAFKPNEDEVNHFRKSLGFPEGDVEESPKPEPTGFFSERDCANEAHFINRPLTPSEKKVDFKQAEAAMNAAEEAIQKPLEVAAFDIYNDLIKQVKEKRILTDFKPENLKQVKPRNLKRMESIFRNAFVDLFKMSKKQAQKELFPKKIQFADATLTPEEFIDVIKTESFNTVGDYSALVTKRSKATITEALKSGANQTETVGLLRDALKSETEKWLSTVVRTKTTEVFNNARRSYWENDPLAKQVVASYEYSAILDSRTSDICSSLDGKIYDKGSPDISRVTPPLHFNCRSLLVPITKFEDHKTDKIPSLKTVNEDGGTLKNFIFDGEVLSASGQATIIGDTMVVSSPGRGRRIELISLTASNGSMMEPVIVGFKEWPDGNVQYREFLDKMGGRLSRYFLPQPRVVSEDTGFAISLSTNADVDYTVEYMIRDVSNGDQAPAA